MKTAKIFRHGGSQAVRLPKEFRLEGSEVEIEKRGDAVVLKPRSKAALGTLADVARYLDEKHPRARGFPDVERLREQQERDLRW